MKNKGQNYKVKKIKGKTTIALQRDKNTKKTILFPFFVPWQCIKWNGFFALACLTNKFKHHYFSQTDNLENLVWN